MNRYDAESGEKIMAFWSEMGYEGSIIYS